MSDRNAAQKHGHFRIERAEPDRLFAMRNGLTIMPRKGQAVTEITMSRRRTWIEIDRPAKRSDRLLGAPFHHRQIAERDLSPGIAIIEHDGPNDMLAAG